MRDEGGAYYVYKWIHPRQHGRAIIQRVVIDSHLRQGDHVHVASRLEGMVCKGGDSECLIWQGQLEIAMEAWSA